MRILRITQYAANDRTYTDPLNFKRTFRETLTVQQKAAGDIKVYNARSEFVTSDTIDIPSPAGGCTDPCVVPTRTEKVTIKTIISGSVESKVKMEALIADHNYNLNLALADHLSGFMSPITIEFVVDSATP